MTDLSRVTEEVIEELKELDILPPVVGIENIIQQAVERGNKKIVAKVERIINEGCGNDFLSDDGDFELMCGKHVWKDKCIVNELHLCENCLAFKERVVRLKG